MQSSDSLRQNYNDLLLFYNVNFLQNDSVQSHDEAIRSYSPLNCIYYAAVQVEIPAKKIFFGNSSGKQPFYEKIYSFNPGGHVCIFNFL